MPAGIFRSPTWLDDLHQIRDSAAACSIASRRPALPSIQLHLVAVQRPPLCPDSSPSGGDGTLPSAQMSIDDDHISLSDQLSS